MPRKRKDNEQSNGTEFVLADSDLTDVASHPAKVWMIPIQFQKGYFSDEGKHQKGSVVEFTVAEAKKLTSAGIGIIDPSLLDSME